MSEEQWPTINTPAEPFPAGGIHLAKGDRVLIRPKAGGDVFDLALTGRSARVDSVEQDFEGRFHVSVLIDDDPARDLGSRKQPGHTFFFAPEELELVAPSEADAAVSATLRILVAGIGNIFLGDDGFGVEVAQRLAARPLPEGVRVMDAGIRGLDLAYALLDGPDRTILVDACPHGDGPGTVFLMEPDLASLDDPDRGGTQFDAHDMNPMNVLRMARSLGATLRHVLIVGCAPETLGPEEGKMGLSESVRAAVPEAMALIESVIAQWTDPEGLRTDHDPRPERTGAR